MKFRPSTLIHRFNSTSFTWTVWELEPFWCIVFWGLKVVSWPGKLCSLMIIINHYLQSTFLQVLRFLHFKELKLFPSLFLYLSFLVHYVATHRHTPMYPSPSALRSALWQFRLEFNRYGIKCCHKSPLSPIQYIDVTKWSIALSHSTTNTVFKALRLSFFSITTPLPAFSLALSTHC